MGGQRKKERRKETPDQLKKTSHGAGAGNGETGVELRHLGGHLWRFQWSLLVARSTFPIGKIQGFPRIRKKRRGGEVVVHNRTCGAVACCCYYYEAWKCHGMKGKGLLIPFLNEISPQIQKKKKKKKNFRGNIQPPRVLCVGGKK